MNKLIIPFFSLFLMLSACGQNITNKNNVGHAMASDNLENKNKAETKTIATRFPVPKGFERIKADSTSYATYLRNLPLKPENELVKYYDGRTKPNSNVYAAVVNLPIGKKDLHQCADAVMRLRAEYLFGQKEYDKIHFNFTNGFKADYATWRKGNRIVVYGNKVSWVKKTNPSNTPKSFWKYLEMVFSYAGTASLEKELGPASVDQMKIGDVFIKGGFPGHAVIVVDMAKNSNTGEQLFLLAQSYMPAQELQVLNNPNSNTLSPWYSVSSINVELQTPEWIFKKTDLKRF